LYPFFEIQYMFWCICSSIWWTFIWILWICSLFWWIVVRFGYHAAGQLSLFKEDLISPQLDLAIKCPSALEDANCCFLIVLAVLIRCVVMGGGVRRSIVAALLTQVLPDHEFLWASVILLGCVAEEVSTKQLVSLTISLN